MPQAKKKIARRRPVGKPPEYRPNPLLVEWIEANTPRFCQPDLSPRAMLEAAIDLALDLLQQIDGDPDTDCCAADDDLGTTGKLAKAFSGYKSSAPGTEEDAEEDDPREEDDPHGGHDPEMEWGGESGGMVRGHNAMGSLAELHHGPAIPVSRLLKTMP